MYTFRKRLYAGTMFFLSTLVGALSRTEGDPRSLHETGSWLSAWNYIRCGTEKASHKILLPGQERLGRTLL